MPRAKAHVRTVSVWHTQTVAIVWSRAVDPQDPCSETETLTVEVTAPPEAVWQAKRKDRSDAGA